MPLPLSRPSINNSKPHSEHPRKRVGSPHVSIRAPDRQSPPPPRLLPSNPPVKKSDEAPEAYYRLRIFRENIAFWTSVANGHRGLNVGCWGLSGRAGGMVLTSACSH